MPERQRKKFFCFFLFTKRRPLPALPFLPHFARMQHKLSIRIDLASGARIGPGKVALLEEIGRSGSISGAGRALKMSYRRAWDLVEELNRQLGASVVSTAAGGAGGGGARLTEAGLAVVAAYRAVEASAADAAAAHVQALEHRLYHGG